MYEPELTSDDSSRIIVPEGMAKPKPCELLMPTVVMPMT